MREVARAYYLEDRSKVEIAESTGLSRWQVARVLVAARDEGIVSIHVDDADDDDLAERLREAMGVRHAVVAPSRVGRRPDANVEAVAQALAAHLQDAVRPGQSLAIGWSRVIEALPAQLPRLAPCDVVQLAGALTFSGDRIGSVEAIRLVARTSGGIAYPVYAPLVAPNGQIAASLLSSPEIADVMERATQADHAVVGIGTWTPEGSSILPILPQELAEATADAGAVAVISGRVLDAEGRPLDVGVDERIVGLTLGQLRSIPTIIGTCFGAHRADAVRAAVRAGVIDVLVVDEPLASALVRR